MLKLSRAPESDFLVIVKCANGRLRRTFWQLALVCQKSAQTPFNMPRYSNYQPSIEPFSYWKPTAHFVHGAIPASFRVRTPKALTVRSSPLTARSKIQHPDHADVC